MDGNFGCLGCHPTAAIVVTMATLLESRNPTVDAIRGIAILGVLANNIWNFQIVTPQVPDPVQLMGLMAIDGRFVGSLAILFGMGMAWQARVSGRRDQAPWPTALARALALLVVGIANHVLLIAFDILIAYALATMAAIPLLRASDRVLGWVIGTGMTLGLGLLVVLSLPGDPQEAQLAAASLGVVVQPWTDQVVERFTELLPGLGILENLELLVWLLPMYAIGILVVRHGWFEGRRISPRWLLPACLVAGAVVWIGSCSVAIAALPSPPMPGAVLPNGATAQFLIMYADQLNRYLAGPLLGLGLIAWMSRLGAQPWMVPLARLGQRSLTAYVMQSVLSVLIMLPCGLGWGVEASATTVIAIAATFALLLLLGTSALDRLRLTGPMEWLWRALARRIRALLRSPELP